MHSGTCKITEAGRVLGVMNSRRHFLRNMLVGSPLLVGARAFAQDAPAPVRVPANDPVAMALGYVEDATKVDAAKYPQYKAGQICEDPELRRPSGVEMPPGLTRISTPEAFPVDHGSVPG